MLLSVIRKYLFGQAFHYQCYVGSEAVMLTEEMRNQLVIYRSASADRRPPQRQQCGAAYIRQAVPLHRDATAGVKLPLRKLQCRRPVQFAWCATQNQTATASHFDLNTRLMSVQGVSAAMHFSDAGFMGVLYPTCTMGVVLTGLSERGRQADSTFSSRLTTN